MKVETMTVAKVEYHDLEDYVRQAYLFYDPTGCFSVVAMEEWNNDSCHLYQLERDPLKEWEQKELDEWKANPWGSKQYILRTILQDMVNNGYLKEGNLLVSVCW